MTIPALTTLLETIPEPTRFPPLLLVMLPPAKTPPLICSEPVLAQSAVTVSALVTTLIVPLLTGAAVSVVSSFRLKLPRLTKLLLTAPMKNIAPVFVTGPFR